MREVGSIPTAPSLRTPSFYGVRDLTVGGKDGFGLRLYFPSWDGAVWSAPIAEGAFPLVVFLHGERQGAQTLCPEDTSDDHKMWWSALHLAARFGIVVACPQLDGVVSADPTSVLPRVTATIDFLRTQWEHCDSLSDRLGVGGHSWGGNAAISVAASSDFAAAAYAGIAVTRENNFARDFSNLDVPLLFVAGTDDFLAGPLNAVNFARGPLPRHQVALQHVGHWGWFSRAEIWPCVGDPDDACVSGAQILSEILATFYWHYLAAETDAVVPYLLETPVGRSDLSRLNDSDCAAQVIYRTRAGSSWPFSWFVPSRVPWGPVPFAWRIFGRFVRAKRVTVGSWTHSDLDPFG